jgi:hypothetical protein
MTAERVGKPQAERFAPEVGPHDESEGLIGCTCGVAVWEGEAQIRLRRRPTGWVGALWRCGPGCHPDFAWLKRLDRRVQAKAQAYSEANQQRF